MPKGTRISLREGFYPGAFKDKVSFPISPNFRSATDKKRGEGMIGMCFAMFCHVMQSYRQGGCFGNTSLETEPTNQQVGWPSAGDGCLHWARPMIAMSTPPRIEDPDPANVAAFMAAGLVSNACRSDGNEFRKLDNPFCVGLLNSCPDATSAVDFACVSPLQSWLPNPEP